MCNLTTPRYSALFVGFAVMLLGCGADGPIGNIGDTAPGSADHPSTIYFPMTAGNHWTYRNSDGSEWSRHVVASFYDARYHSVSYEPTITLDSLDSTEHVTLVDRVLRRTSLAELTDMVWEVILESSEGLGDWRFGVDCDNRRRKPWCKADKDSLRPRIMALLYFAKPKVVWYSRLTLLPNPVLPKETYNALEFRLKGAGDVTYNFDFEADGNILGRTGTDWESVETPAGSFEKCLKIEYEPDLESFEIIDFEDLHPVDEDIFLKSAREVIESELHDELNNLLTDLIPKMGLHTMWIAPGVGPVKIETPYGMAELIDYDIKRLQ